MAFCYRLMTLMSVLGILSCPFVCTQANVAAEEEETVSSCCGCCHAGLAQRGTCNSSDQPSSKAPVSPDNDQDDHDCVCQMIGKTSVKRFALTLDQFPHLLDGVVLREVLSTTAVPRPAAVDRCSMRPDHFSGISMRLAFSSLLF
ncbi:hypothetical protein Pan216_07510 [Planctomycetes bacterium Pan216]|uniref:Secreted protein n=1 Tax=Kolteria novifilia TaxID=2527975 RepID=A0A518AYW3_9BACT|nr:hypothetical protein Pan216_07510 [Planctomycetes bacterium Pan216]